MDPRAGEVAAYPAHVAERLEAAYLAGGGREVRLAGLGGVFECITIDLGTDDQSATQFNPMTGGRRDVRRAVVDEDQDEVEVHVVRERGWRLVDVAVPDLTEPRILRLGHRASAGGGGEDGRGARPRGGPPVDPVAEREARLAAAESCDRAGLVGLWEWCRIPATEGDEVPQDMWGVYGEDQDSAIEEAFRSGAPSVALSIGIRSYEVTFRGASGGRQEDKAMRKRRLVRRRQATATEREAALGAAACETNEETADGECAICCASFAETAAVPVVRLPDCGHCFHGACVQHIADRQGTCPFCRAEVDWAAALMPQARRVPSGPPQLAAEGLSSSASAPAAGEARPAEDAFEAAEEI